MNYKLGKKKAKQDKRTLYLANILRQLPPIPEVWDHDAVLPHPVPTPMFANDRWGDCVIAGRAHMTLRMEHFEQDVILPITDDDVLQEYWREGQRGCALARWILPRPDNGLVMLDSLNWWRKNGWLAGGQMYNIYAYGQIKTTDHANIKTCMYLLGGVYAGIWLPASAKEERQQGLPWEETSDQPGSWGGHCVYVMGYDQFGLTCVTWGAKQRMSWAFWDKYADECYGVVDNRDRFLVSSPVDVEKLDAYLKEVTS